MSNPLSLPHTPLCRRLFPSPERRLTLSCPLAPSPVLPPHPLLYSQGFRDLASLWLQHILLRGCHGCSLVLGAQLQPDTRGSNWDAAVPSKDLCPWKRSCDPRERTRGEEMWKLTYRILDLDGTLEHSYSRPLGPQRGKPGGEVMCQGQMLGGARWRKPGIRGHIGTKGEVAGASRCL